jgi:hypothetical protein
MKKYKILVENDSLSFKYNDLKLAEINSNSNNFQFPIKSKSYLFNDTSGFLFNSNNNSIVSTTDFFIDGTLNAKSFPSNLLILDSNNKINSSYLPSITNFSIFNTNSIAIGTTTPIANIQLNDGSAYLNNSRFGIGTFPSYYFHLNKVDTMHLQPAFVITSNSKHIIDIYTELGTVIINNDNSPIDTTAKLNVKGLLKADEIKTPSFINSNNATIINNELYINNLNSFQSSIIINSNIDLILSNNSIGSISSNIIYLNNSIQYLNNNPNLILSSSNTTINNLTTSNLNILNKDSLTSNPYVESVMDFKGKIRLYNDTENIIINIFANNTQLFLITKNNKLYSYSSNQISLISSNFFYDTFKAKYNSYAYTFNNNLYLNGNLLLENKIIRDFAISPNNYIFYLNEIGAVISTNTQTISNNFINLKKIETYLDNSFIVLTNDNRLYYYYDNFYSPITIPSSTLIEDIVSGDDHTLIKTNDGLWSFGGNTNNLTFKKGYSTYQNFTIAMKINYFNNYKIKSIKALQNSSIVIDINSNVYIFGNINKLYQSQQIYKITDVTNVLDFCCDNNNVFLLSYFNDLFTLGTNNNSIIINLNDDFYGTSIKSKGSIIIGGNYFYKNIPKNSLFVQNFIGIGTNVTYNPNYSMIINGNINVTGSIFNNDVLFTGNGSSTSSVWKKNINDIYYDLGNVGIGIVKPDASLHVDGNTIIESNLIVKGKIVSSEISPFIYNNPNDIYYRGKVNINSLELNDGTFIINSIIPTSNLLYYDNFQKTLVTNTNNTIYYNPIKINENSTIIVNSYYTLDDINNNNNITIYKKINNNWIKYQINDISFGQSFAISKDGSSIFIGAYKAQLISGTQTGGIYKYSFDNLNNLIKDSNRILSINQNNTYNYIGKNLICSGDGNILISTISNNNYKLYIQNFKQDNEKILDFIYFNSFHATFNPINPNQIFMDTTYDGSIILINYIFDISSLDINDFIYFNFYIIKDFEIYFLKINKNFENSFVSSLSISGDGLHILISFSSGHHFVYEINFQNYKTTNYNSTTIIKYFDLEPSLKIYKNNYKGFFAKSGNIFYLSNNINVLIYKFNYTYNIWEERTFINIPQNIHNYSLSIDENGFNLSMSVLKKINDTNLIDNIEINNYLFNLNKYQSVFNYNSSNLTIDTDVSFNSNIICKNLTANGSNIYNVQTNNLVNNYNQNGLMYTSNNLVYSSSNITYENDLDRLKIDVIGLFTSNVFILSNLTAFSNISTTYGDIISGKNIISTSNINSYSNIICVSNISTTIGNITSASNISAVNNITANNNIVGGNRISCFFDIVTIYGNIKSGNNLISEKDIIAKNQISTTIGNISGASNLYITSNIFANKNIYGYLFFGDGSNLSNINPSNIISPVQIDKGGTGRDFINHGEILIGNGSNSINSYNDFTLDYNTKTLNVSNINIGSNLILNGSNFSNLNFSFQQITGINNFEKGGLGFNKISKNNLIFANEENELAETSNIRWDNSTSNFYINGFIHGNGSNITNLSYSNISGIIGFDKGGLGFNKISKSHLIFASDNDKLKETSNLRWDNTNSNLYVDGNIYVNKIFGDGCNISNLRVDFETIGGIIPFQKGGFGFNKINKSSFIYANEENNIQETSNIRWDTSNFYVDGDIRAGSFYGDGFNISNIKVDFESIGGVIPFNKGGLGFNQISKSNLIFAIEDNKLIQTSNLRWDEFNSNFYIDGYIYGDGSNISNINSSNFISPVQVDKGGTGCEFFNHGEILFGNGSNSINSVSDFYIDYKTKTLNVSNISISSNLILNGGNFTNLNFTFDQIIGIIGFEKGGLGFNEISKSNLIFANEDNQLKQTSNLRWDELNSNLYIDGYIYGDGSNISNINYSNITGIIGFNKGGLGFNEISKSNLIFANEDNQLKQTSNIRWDEINSNLYIDGYIYGDGSNISNINYSNITGIIGVEKGGLGFNEISKSNLIFSNEDNQLKQTSNLRWDEINSNLIINGYLNVGFNDYDKDYKIKVDGNVYVSGNVIGLSDINFKKNIENIENPLDKIEKLRGVYFNYKNNDEKRQIGMIAQEVERIIPEVVYNTNENTKAIAYNNLIGLLIEGMKELANLIKSK